MKDERGFTLIEIIIVVVIFSVAAALFIIYSNTSLLQSPAAANLVSDQYKLIQQMEVLNGKYRQTLKSEGGTIADLCAFKTTYVNGLQIDGQPIVDAATSCTFSIKDTTETYETVPGNLLFVRLTYNNQTVQTIFSK